METEDKVEKIHKLELKRSKITEISDESLARVQGAMMPQVSQHDDCKLSIDYCYEWNTTERCG